MTAARAKNFQPDVLRDQMKRHRINTVRLAGEIAMSRTVVSGWLNGHIVPDVGTMPKLADRFGIEALEFVGKTNDEANLVELRVIQGLSGQKVADRAGLTYRQVQTLEEAGMMPNKDHLIAISRALKVRRGVVYQAWLRSRAEQYGRIGLENIDAETKRFVRPWLKDYLDGTIEIPDSMPVEALDDMDLDMPSDVSPAIYDDADEASQIALRADLPGDGRDFRPQMRHLWYSP